MLASALREFSIIEKWFLVIFLFVKIMLLVKLPLTGDEAYFIQWGKQFALGYYDHPPVVGWTIWMLNWFNDHLYVYRAFAFLTTVIITLLLYRLVFETHSQRIATYIALAYFASPISMLGVILTNDIVLTFFGVLGFYTYQKANQSNSVKLAIVSGVFFALTFLSKYLSAMFFLGIFIYSMVNFRKINWRVSITVAVIVSLAIFENIYYNLQNCWNNILFNLVSRTKDSGFEVKNLLLLIISLSILISPLAIITWIRKREKLSREYVVQSLYVCSIFLLVFLLVSLSKTVGLHWFALMMPFAYLLMAQLPAAFLSGLFKYAAIVSIIIGTALLVIVSFSEQFFDLKRKKRDIALYLNTEEVCKILPNDVVFTTGYSSASVLAYHCKSSELHVIFDQSKYGREDDKRIDFKQYAGKDLYIFDLDDDIVDQATPYFESIETKSIEISTGTTFLLLKGRNFNFEKYREVVLKPVCNKYYSAPDWLPEGKCRFKEKYGL